MKLRMLPLFVCLGSGVLFAQTHISVPLDNPVYYILEQAQLRGLVDPLPAVKPYSRAQVIDAIDTILGFPEKLSDTERSVLEDARQRLGNGRPGMDFKRGAYRFETRNSQGENWFSGDVGVGIKSVVSGGYYTKEKDAVWGTNDWASLYLDGDVGERLSFDVTVSGGLIRAPRDYLGTYDTYYKGFVNKGSYINQPIKVYGESPAFFPYTFQKEWDGFVFGTAGLTAGGLEKWPGSRGIGSSLQSELSGVLFDGALTMRFGRLRREWGAMTEGSSLAFNRYAQPFLALEATFNPVSWFAFSSLTGVLEYYNSEGTGSAWNFQNAFSIEQLEFNYKNYLHIDVGSSVVWPKRFELGYIFPINNNFLYQYNIGDYDNMGLFFNIRGQYPGVGALWFSAYLDEIEVASASKIFKLDRHMFAFQGGIKAVFPWLPFASVRLSYTKIEPYTYTHTRIYAPWLAKDSGHPYETSYTNNGVGLGYYLPPNSDEILLRIETMPVPSTGVHVQYQMIRHGADHGDDAVDGSNYRSELDPDNRGSITKRFLHDGAYQWLHIVKVGANHTFANFPLELFGEAGVVYSYYKGFSAAHKAQYPDSFGIIVTIGFRLFPR
ncbi:MAG: hypothetical protein LBG26_02265 [Treponema sp.]|nr:hypothetical protein [Treponema sp.]